MSNHCQGYLGKLAAALVRVSFDHCVLVGVEVWSGKNHDHHFCR